MTFQRKSEREPEHTPANNGQFHAILRREPLVVVEPKLTRRESAHR